MNFIKNQYKLSFTYYKERIGTRAKLCVTAFVLLSIVFHFVFLRMPDKVEVFFNMIAEMMNELEIPDYGYGSFVGLFANNIQASFLTVLYGFIPFLPMAIVSLGMNIFIIPVTTAYAMQSGMSAIYVIGMVIMGILPHGIFEIPALCISVALSMNLSEELTKRLTGRNEVPFHSTLVNTAKIFILYVAPLLLIAGLIEGFITPLLLGM